MCTDYSALHVPCGTVNRRLLATLSTTHAIGGNGILGVSSPSRPDILATHILLLERSVEIRCHYWLSHIRFGWFLSLPVKELICLAHQIYLSINESPRLCGTNDRKTLMKPERTFLVGPVHRRINYDLSSL